MKEPVIKTKTFVKFVSPSRLPDMPVENREVETLSLPEECEFYFYDSYVGIIKGIEYPFGPSFNESKHYFKAREHYTRADFFRVYFMMCYGRSEEEARNPNPNPEDDFPHHFSQYSSEEYPQGVLIVNSIITNPKDGIILSVKEEINEYRIPSQKTIDSYLDYMD